MHTMNTVGGGVSHQKEGGRAHSTDWCIHGNGRGKREHHVVAEARQSSSKHTTAHWQSKCTSCMDATLDPKCLFGSFAAKAQHRDRPVRSIHKPHAGPRG